MRLKKRKIFAMLLCLMLVLVGMNLNGLCIVNMKADTAEGASLPDGFITDIRLGYQKDGEFVAYTDTDENSIKKDGGVVLGFYYDIPANSSLETGKEYSFTLTTKNLSYETEECVIALRDKNGGKYDVYGANNTVVAEVQALGLDSGDIKVTLTFKDAAATEGYFENGSTGFFWFNAYFNGASIANEGQQQIKITPSIGEKSYTIPVNFEVTSVEANLTVNKNACGVTQENGTIYIPWEITATPSLKGGEKTILRNL